MTRTIETLSLSAAFAAVGALAAMPLGHHVTELGAALAMALALAALALAERQVSLCVARWRPTAGGLGMDAAGLLAALATLVADRSEHRAIFLALLAIATSARIADALRVP